MEPKEIFSTIGTAITIIAALGGLYYTYKRFEVDRLHREKERTKDKNRRLFLIVRDISHFEKDDKYYTRAHLILQNRAGYSILLKDMSFGIRFIRQGSLLNQDLDLYGNYPECRETSGTYELITDRPAVMKPVRHLLAMHMVTLVDAHDGSPVNFQNSYSPPFEIADGQTLVWQLQVIFSAKVKQYLEQQQFYLHRPWVIIKTHEGKVKSEYD